MSIPAAASLTYIFAANSRLIDMALDGVVDDDLWRRVLPASNPILWIAGHMVGTRAQILGILGETIDTGWRDVFARGASLGDVSHYPSRDEVLRVHAGIATQLGVRLAALTVDDLARPITAGPRPFGAQSFAEQLGFFALHDSYHAGQLGYVRKALGLPNLVG